MSSESETAFLQHFKCVVPDPQETLQRSFLVYNIGSKYWQSFTIA